MEWHQVPSFLSGLFLFLLVVLYFGLQRWDKKDTERQAKRGYIIKYSADADCHYITYTEGENRFTLEQFREDKFYSVPGDTKWHKTMPEWARDRKGQIMERIYAHCTDSRGKLMQTFREEE